MDEMTAPTPQDPADPQRGYRLGGRFLEACDCEAICPCWIDEVPDEERCTGVYVWDITTGDADGYGLDGLRVASVSFHEGKRRTARQTVVLFIDERADSKQADVLAELFAGKRGGPLGELAMMLGEIAARRRAKIDIVWDGLKATLDIEGQVRVATQPKIGPSGRVTTLTDPAMADELGSPAHVALSDDFRVSVSELEDKVDVKGRSATTGWFSYLG